MYPQLCSVAEAALSIYSDHSSRLTPTKAQRVNKINSLFRFADGKQLIS